MIKLHLQLIYRSLSRIGKVNGQWQKFDLNLICCGLKQVIECLVHIIQMLTTLLDYYFLIFNVTSAYCLKFWEFLAVWFIREIKSFEATSLWLV